MLWLPRKQPWDRFSQELFATLRLHSPLLLLATWSYCTHIQLKSNNTITIMSYMFYVPSTSVICSWEMCGMYM